MPTEQPLPPTTEGVLLFANEEDRIISIPVVDSVNGLRVAVEHIVVPGLSQLRGTMAAESGIGLVSFHNTDEEILDTDSEALRLWFQALSERGIQVDRELLPCLPKRECLVSNRSKKIGYWREDEFAGMMWVLGPMMSNTLVQREVLRMLRRKCFSTIDYQDTTTMLFDSSVAFAGRVLLNSMDSLTAGERRVGNQDICKMLEHVFPPGTLT